MPIVVRDVAEHDLDAVLALNNAAGATILPIGTARLDRLYETAGYFRVAERDGHLAGFLIGFDAKAEHDSSNFRWFRAQHDDFFYIDRVVVASRRRGGGLGRAFYADVQSHAELRYPQLACEVFLGDGNDPALLFHGSFGFREIGQHVMTETGLRAAMLMKDLCSHAWVHATYGERLPDVPWVSQPRNGGETLPATGTSGH